MSSAPAALGRRLDVRVQVVLLYAQMHARLGTCARLPDIRVRKSFGH
jgi:hypothetical protein